jgi:hypothetical protein
LACHVKGRGFDSRRPRKKKSSKDFILCFKKGRREALVAFFCYLFKHTALLVVIFQKAVKRKRFHQMPHQSPSNLKGFFNYQRLVFRREEQNNIRDLMDESLICVCV